MTVATDKILRCAVRFSQVTGEDVVNVYHIKTAFATPQAEADVLDAVDAYLTDVYAIFDNHLDNSMVPVDVRVDVVQFALGKWTVVQNIGTKAFGSTLTLAATADALPSGTAVLGRLITSALKRAGSKYFGVFTTDSNSTNGGVGATTIAAVAGGLSVLLTSGTISAGNTIKAVVASQTDGFVSDIISVAADYIWAYQRRRKLNVGS